MTVLCTFPGRYGDLLWALPTIRALSRRLGQRIDLQIAGEFENIVDLLLQQDYLGAIYADGTWGMEGPWWQAPPIPGVVYEHVFHLGYRRWPELGLPFETLHTYNTHHSEYSLHWIDPEELDLQTPWITAPYGTPVTPLAVGFTEAWFELKYGLLACLDRYLPPYWVLTPPGSRWVEEESGQVSVQPGDWLRHAGTIRSADRFFGDCSALHVLAVAMGTPVLLMEPMEARWNPIFYPLGMDGPQVTVVMGTDGKPTFDARHCREALGL